jgi:hypothetical protein
MFIDPLTPKENLMPRKTTINVEMLELLAAAGISQSKAADVLGVVYATLTGRLANDPEIRAAWNRGEKADNNGGYPAPSHKEARRLVLEALWGAELEWAALRDATGLDVKFFGTAVSDLVAAGLVIETKDEGGTVYRLATKGDARPADAQAEEDAGEQDADETPAAPVETSPVKKTRKRRAAKKAAGKKAAGKKAAVKKSAKRASKKAARKSPALATREAEIVGDSRLQVLAPAGLPSPSAPVSSDPASFSWKDKEPQELLQVLTRQDDALQAAQVELRYAAYWGESSPKLPEVARKVEEALTI